MYQPQQPYGQQSYEQQGQSQPQQLYETSQQPQSYMQQQTSYGNATQQWQQPQYAQPQPPYGRQFDQEYAQNNMPNPIRKKSKAPLIIGIVAAILIIAGLAVTGIILLNSSTPSTPEETVERFLDAILDEKYEDALDYLHPIMFDDGEYKGNREKAIREMENWITSYDDMSSEKMDEEDIFYMNEYLKEYGYNDEVTEESWVRVHIEGPSVGSDDYYEKYPVVKINEKWYILEALH